MKAEKKMTTLLLVDNIKSVKVDSRTTLKSYNDTVNDMLDAINNRKRMFDEMAMKLNSINMEIKDFICEYEEADEVIHAARSLIRVLRTVTSSAKKDKLFSGYRSSFYTFSQTIDDFEEYMQDFKFRHNKEAQNELQRLLDGFTFSL